MSPAPSHPAAAEATRRFLDGVLPRAPLRFEAKVCGPDGLPVLCAVEAVLWTALPKSTTQELVWLSGSAAGGGHRLRLQAFGRDNELLAEAVHEIVAEPA